MIELDETQVIEFCQQSNLIEGEESPMALRDAIAAFGFALQLLGTDKAKPSMSTSDVLQIHQILMQNVRTDIAGKFRTCNVRIGGKVKKFHSTGIFEDELSDVLATMLSEARHKGADREEMAKHCHVMFEEIHPFEDGNGRVGRILYNWHRLTLGLPLHVIHVGQEQRDYYKWFQQGHEKN